MQVRQGDVFLELVPTVVPEEAQLVPKENGKVVLAHGEATGHAHTIKKNAKLFTHNSKRFLQVDMPTALDHQEHSAVELPCGTYEVIQQREYHPQEIRNVRD